MISSFPDSLKLKDSVTGAINQAESHHNFLINVPYTEAIGLGVVSGHSMFRGLGRREALSTAAAGDDIWEGTATSISYPDQSVGQQMAVRSSSVNDTAAGTGVRKIHVHYIDAAGDQQEEEVTMNGTTLVNTVATDIRFIQYIHTSEHASFGGAAAGNITIENTAGTIVYNQITVGGNMSLSTARMVPAGYSFYLQYIKPN